MWKLKNRKIKLILIGFLTITITFFYLLFLGNYVEKKETQKVIEKITNTKLTIDDVMGVNLPPDPGKEADKTIKGVDVNNNGIRDDVELAIFKKYPNSAKMRAPLLQYALTLQLEMTLDIVNEETVTILIGENESRADVCLWSLSNRDNLDKFIKEVDLYEKFIKDIQINTTERRLYMDNFYKFIRSYTSSNKGCDINLTELPN